MSAENPKCETCRWWYDGGSQCRRYAPKSTVIKVLGEVALTHWPITDKADFCGEHSSLTSIGVWPIGISTTGSPAPVALLGKTPTETDARMFYAAVEGSCH